MTGSDNNSTLSMRVSSTKIYSRPDIIGNFGHLPVKGVYVHEKSAPIASSVSNGSKPRYNTAFRSVLSNVLATVASN